MSQGRWRMYRPRTRSKGLRCCLTGSSLWPRYTGTTTRWNAALSYQYHFRSGQLVLTTSLTLTATCDKLSVKADGSRGLSRVFYQNGQPCKCRTRSCGLSRQAMEATPETPMNFTSRPASVTSSVGCLGVSPQRPRDPRRKSGRDRSGNSWVPGDSFA